MTQQSEISRELVERMATAICIYVSGDARDSAEFRMRTGHSLWCEFQAIAELLPKPVDPDLIEARELFIEMEGGVDAHRDVVIDIRKGAADCSEEIQLLLKGIKRGRSLARTQEAGE